ncbi:DUF2076 domain-containing protein [Azonexus sp. IMCC34842]|uniref:DUF2076 domain-containing protein n=1 Tax=Azonexus sp. IMCC34842 TaxID=3420950 RepID=UPI003D1405AE
MNTNEQQQLNSFLQQLVQAQIGSKDAEAERIILEACRNQPDAHYLLVQRCLLLDQALQAAQAELAKLKTQDSHREPSGSFLDANGAWGNSAAQRPVAQTAAPYAPAAPGPAPSPAASSWGSGLLGTVASTAAGVVAGSFLFQGIEHLMGSHNNHASPLSDTGNLTPKVPAENTTANNFMDTGSSSLDDLSALDVSDGDTDWI